MAIKLVLVLDESGSMGVVRDATIEGVNSYLNSLEGEIYVSVVKFNTEHLPLYSGLLLVDAPRLDYDNYHPNGGTALYDALKWAMENVTLLSHHDKVLIVVVTDGEDNSSRLTTKDRIIELIKEKESMNNWTFVYLGANQNAWKFANQMGFNVGNTLSYDHGETREAMAGLSSATQSYARSNTASTKNFFTPDSSADEDKKNS